jgi:phospholipid transport system substrate-binding protein
MARMLSRIGVILALLLLFAPERGHAEGVAAARAIVEDLSTRVLNLVSTGHIDPVRKRQGFDTLLSEHFDMATIGRFVLGRYWRVATPAEKDRYLSRFKKIVVETYANRFSAYDGQRLRVINAARLDTRYVIVNSEIYHPDRAAPVYRVDWRLIDRKGALKIIDVVIEGVSLSIAQRSEYGAYIRANGGKIANLLVAMDRQLASFGIVD